MTGLRNASVQGTRKEENLVMSKEDSQHKCRMHANVTVADLDDAVEFYSSLFGVEPMLRHDDYAKWMLEDPRLNFVVSTHGDAPGLTHLGIQFETYQEIEQIANRLTRAGRAVEIEHDAHCGYARSHKAWINDTENLQWEMFYTFETSPDYGSHDEA